MDVTNILRRLAALSDPQDDDTQWATCPRSNRDGPRHQWRR